MLNWVCCEKTGRKMHNIWNGTKAGYECIENLHQLIRLLSGESTAAGVSHVVNELCFMQSVVRTVLSLATLRPQIAAFAAVSCGPGSAAQSAVEKRMAGGERGLLQA
jgi:hypothetical protein